MQTPATYATMPGTRLVVIMVLGMSICAAESIEAAGRACQKGQAKACAELRRIATTAKGPKDRLAAIPFISDTDALSAIANDAALRQDVTVAARSRLDALNRQAQDQARVREEERRSIMPDMDAIQAQIRTLASYTLGVTTLAQFYGDKWTTRDALLTKLGIVGARHVRDTYEFDIGYYGDFNKKASAQSVLGAAKLVEQNSPGVLFSTFDVSEWHPMPLYDRNGQIPLTDVDKNYPQYHLRFVDGRLASITKTNDLEPFTVQSNGVSDTLISGGAFTSDSRKPKQNSADNAQKSEADYLQQQQVKARHILIRFKGSPVPLRDREKDLTEVEALAKAKELRQKALNGADFAMLAKAESDDLASAANGGNLGTIGHGQNVQTFEQAAFNTPVGGISEPVKTQFGYSIIKIESRHFIDVPPEIERKLNADIASKVLDERK
jgi:hypothetical protein